MEFPPLIIGPQPRPSKTSGPRVGGENALLPQFGFTAVLGRQSNARVLVKYPVAIFCANNPLVSLDIRAIFVTVTVLRPCYGLVCLRVCHRLSLVSATLRPASLVSASVSIRRRYTRSITVNVTLPLAIATGPLKSQA